MVRPLGSPTVRQARPKVEKYKAGVITAYLDFKGNIAVIYWGEDKQRCDRKKKSWKPRPLCLYWDNMFNSMFKKW